MESKFIIFVIFHLVASARKSEAKNKTLIIFQSCQKTKTNYCLNGGECFENSFNSKDVFCRCVDNFFGEKCEEKNLEALETYLYISIFVAAVFFIAFVMTLCHLYLKLGEIKHLKSVATNDDKYMNQKRSAPANRSNHERIGLRIPVMERNIARENNLDYVVIDGKKKVDVYSDTLSLNSDHSNKSLLSHNNNGTIPRPKSWNHMETETIFQNPDTLSLRKQRIGRRRSNSIGSQSTITASNQLLPYDKNRPKARSLQNLRDEQMGSNSTNIRKVSGGVKNGYIENIHTGRISKIETNPSTLKPPETDKTPKGIWARSQENIKA